jgi:hypothetical protein
MIVTIETYRGFEIYFNTLDEKFSTIPTEDSTTEDSTKKSKSYATCKQHIDEYLKENNNFKSFEAEAIPSYSYVKDNQIKVIGIRKDGRFVIETSKGEKKQLSDYDLQYYMLKIKENETIIHSYNVIKVRRDKVHEIYNNKLNDLIKKLNVKSLEKYKKELLGEK